MQEVLLVPEPVLFEKPRLRILRRQEDVVHMHQHARGQTRQDFEIFALLRPGLKDVRMDPAIFRPATFIERSLDSLSKAMLVGCILVIVVLITFLFDWRTSLISLSRMSRSVTPFPFAIDDSITKGPRFDDAGRGASFGACDNGATRVST